MGADWDDVGLPRGRVESNHKMKHCVENMVLMAFPPAAAQFTTITSASISATSNHSLCCGKPSGFAFPKLYLFRAPSAASAGSFLECWLTDENAPQYCHSPLQLMQVLPHPFLRYNPYSHIWQIFALKLNHTYDISCIFCLISLQFTTVCLCPSRWFMPQKCYYPCWELTLHTVLASAHWVEFHTCFSSSSCLRLSWTQWRYRDVSGTSLETPQWGHLRSHICRALLLQALPPSGFSVWAQGL